jgi:hypothetical protein
MKGTCNSQNHLSIVVSHSQKWSMKDGDALTISVSFHEMHDLSSLNSYYTMNRTNLTQLKSEFLYQQEMSFSIESFLISGF